MNTIGGRSAVDRSVDPRSVHWQLETGRYWQGVAAAALAAICTTLVGLLIVRGLFGLPVLRRGDGGALEQASTAWYLVAAVVATVLAAALLQLLLAYSPRPW